ncbi:M48 family metallopeptidase [Pseudarthrobacter oxydans]|uniref:M48 family metallopeptidase n=1 Tax=Pseudarthrobacter oxydans TaxID=1671 RepID=UPI0037F88159
MMSTASTSITVSGLDVEVLYKDIKNLHISVYPPAGRVRVAAPERLDEDTIRRAIVQRLPWIKRQREQFQGAERQGARQMLSGESHYVWGRRYRLDVSRTSGNHGVKVSGGTLWVVAPEGASAEERLAVLERWYRRELKAAIPRLLDHWKCLIGVEPRHIGVRRMKTKWGTCNPDNESVWFNPELAKKNPRCLEYVVVHELTHLQERTHNERFVELMNGFLPDWRVRQEELNGAPLADEDWR